MSKHTQFYSISLACAAISLFSVTQCQLALAGSVLRGGVIEQNKLTGPPAAGPVLNRNDMNKDDDAFGNDDGQQQQPNFGVQTTLPPPPPKKAFPLNANTDGDAFNPQMMNAMPDQPPRQPQQLTTNTPNNPQFYAQDPDSSPEMRVAWDAWHKRVATVVYQRYATLSNAAFQNCRRPLLASAGYVVTRDGRIVNAQLLQTSWNPIYNTLILGVINSLSGDMSVLAFPEGSRRMMVEKSATFSQNYGGEGFRYTTGDHESIKLRPQQPGGR